MPKVSVILSALNAEKYIAETIESILSQSLKDFEFIMVDDGSNDSTYKIMSSYDDNRVILIKNERNLGIAASLNKALKNASGKYIAKMDADDKSALTRLEKQAEFLDANSSIGIVGTGAYHINSNSHVTSVHKQPESDEILRFALCFYYPFYNSSLMVRKSILDKHNITHDESYRSAAEDFAFVSQIIPHCKIANLPVPLQYFRKHNESTCEQNTDKQHTNNNKIAYKNLSLLVGKKFNNSELNTLLSLLNDKNVSKEMFITLIDLFDAVIMELQHTNTVRFNNRYLVGIFVIKLILNNKKLALYPSIFGRLLFNKKWGMWDFLFYQFKCFTWKKHYLRHKQ